MKTGCIHGRFQPFHNGHLSYTLCALENVDYLYIGVTRISLEDISNSSALRAGLHSGEFSSNPFSYFQRLRLIDSALTLHGITRDRFSIIPFPIEKIEALPTFFPRSGVCLTTVKDDWNIKKIDLLRGAGYDVKILDNIEKHGFFYSSGTEIRAWARDNDKKWRSAVPEGVSALLPNWDGNPVPVDEWI